MICSRFTTINFPFLGDQNHQEKLKNHQKSLCQWFSYRQDCRRDSLVGKGFSQSKKVIPLGINDFPMKNFERFSPDACKVASGEVASHDVKRLIYGVGKNGFS